VGPLFAAAAPAGIAVRGPSELFRPGGAQWPVPELDWRGSSDRTDAGFFPEESSESSFPRCLRLLRAVHGSGGAQRSGGGIRRSRSGWGRIARAGPKRGITRL